LLAFAVMSFGSIFSIVDPFSAMPVFVALVGDEPREVQAKVALRAALTCAAVLATFGIAGAIIMHFFGITIAAFKIAGGIILFGVAFEMMHARESSTRSTTEEQVEAETKADVGVIPLGLPLLSGPGAIAAVMVLVGKADSFARRLTVYVTVLVVSLLAFLILRSASQLARFLGRTGINVIGRVMGLLLAALAAQFILDGLREAFPRVLGS
jgi:multiple antibiotic resistance protein